MKISLEGTNIVKQAEILETALDMKFINNDSHIGDFDGHKFKPGEKAILFGLEDYQQFNGEIVTITNIRKSGKYGRAYYFETNNEDLANNLNWTYEYRLKRIK